MCAKCQLRGLHKRRDELFISLQTIQGNPLGFQFLEPCTYLCDPFIASLFKGWGNEQLKKFRSSIAADGDRSEGCLYK